MNTCEILKKIKLIESELVTRRGNSKLRAYNTGERVHKKQLEFHKCNKRNRWVFGGNRSGKTECGAVETVWLARGIHPFCKNYPTDGWVVSLSREVQRDVAQSKVLSYLPKEWIADVVMQSGRKDFVEGGVVDYILVKNVFGSTSKIGFKSCDQGREKFQGTSLDYVWFDEEPTFEIYLECRMRVLDKVGKIYGTMTPLKGMTWVYETIYLNASCSPDIWCETMEWADNPFLNLHEIENLSASLSESELDSRRFGRFVDFGGRVYTEFDENIHVIDPFDVPKEWFDNISIDPGLNNPLSAHWYAVDYDGNIFVIAEHYEAKKDIIYHSKKIKEISTKLRWHTASNGMFCALIDSAATQRTLSAEKSVVELFYDNGIITNPKVEKNLFTGIQKVKSYLKNGEGKARLYIFKNCYNLIRELKSYYWGKGDSPIKKDDHSVDELRYYIMSRPETPVQIIQKTEIQKHKEKLIRDLKNINNK
ncbi:MAG: terminase family protein [Clostridia bacterium]